MLEALYYAVNLAPAVTTSNCHSNELEEQSLLALEGFAESVRYNRNTTDPPRGKDSLDGRTWKSYFHIRAWQSI
jgi:hypothetical protein